VSPRGLPTTLVWRPLRGGLCHAVRLREGETAMSLFGKALELVRRYGAPAKFAVKTVLGAVVPGSPAVIPSPVENRLVSRTRGAGDCVSRHGSAGTGYLSTRRAFQRVLV